MVNRTRIQEKYMCITLCMGPYAGLTSPYHIVNSISQLKQSVSQLATLTTSTSNTQIHIDPLIIIETLTHRGLS